MTTSKYLLDKEIELTSEEDLLGSSIYVEQLSEMIKYSMKTQQVESIGLYGGWGSGKTSIVKSLKSTIESKNELKKCRFFTYNAWQYNNDSFRKNFIASIIDNENGKKIYLDKVYTSVTQTKIEINKKLKKYWYLVIALIILVAVFYFYTKSQLNENDFNNVLSFLSNIIGLGFFAYVMDFIFKKIAVETQISIHKEYSPYDFLDDFKKQIEKKKYYSIFVIDDIDRCSNTQVLEILETIKGLLKSVDKCNYLFLIPLDKDRVISILKNERNYSESDCQNYFSKIFDLSIDIKKLGDLNLFEMAKKKAIEINLNISNKSLSLLADFVFLTPRDVKYTLNSLMTINQLVERKFLYNLVIDEMNEELLEEFVVIFILEYKWKSFFDFLVMNLSKKRIDLSYEFSIYKNNHYIKNRSEELELSRYIDRLTSKNLNYLEAYIFLKNDKVSINKVASRIMCKSISLVKQISS